MANAVKIRAVLDYIADHPKEWNQSTYGVRTDCGSAYCAAGHAIVLNGHKIVWWEADESLYRSDHAIDKETGLSRSIHNLATRELEFSVHEASEFFDEFNTLGDLWTLANKFTGGRVGYRD